jgi:hypothetical protein
MPCLFVICTAGLSATLGRPAKSFAQSVDLYHDRHGRSSSAKCQLNRTTKTRTSVGGCDVCTTRYLRPRVLRPPLPVNCQPLHLTCRCNMFQRITCHGTCSVLELGRVCTRSEADDLSFLRGRYRRI